MENCILCSTKLKFINTPAFGKGKLSDGGIVCVSCHNKINKLNSKVALNLKSNTLSDIEEILQLQNQVESKNTSNFKNTKAKKIIAELTTEQKVKTIVYIISAIFFLWFFLSPSSESEIENESIHVTEELKLGDPLNIGIATVKSLLSKKVPYEKWKVWGSPETLDGTNNKHWVVYLSTANISFVSDKKSDLVIFADFEKSSALNYIKAITSKPESQELSYSSTEKWYEGGTLYKGTVEEWKNATDRNKLATCADYVVNIKKSNNGTYSDMETMKRDAIELRTCINEAVKGEGASSLKMKISEVAALCAMTMSNQ